MSGRTLWRAKDCEWSMRERVIALGEEFGPAGPMVLDWLEEQAKKQRGRVLTGYRAVARGAFLIGGPDEAQRVVTRAVVIGALDDFEDLGELRFRCRVSGFGEDQRMAQDAARKQAKRDEDTAVQTSADTSGPDRTNADNGEGFDAVEPKGEKRTGADESGHDRTPTRVRGEERRELLKTSSSKAAAVDTEIEPVREDVNSLCHLLATLIRRNDPKAKVAPNGKRWQTDMRLLLDADGRDATEVRHVIQFCAADDFERSNVLSPGKLRERFTQLAMKANTTPSKSSFDALVRSFDGGDAA